VTCPACGSANHERYRAPTFMAGNVLRRHLCRDCRKVFLSVEIVVESLDHLEQITKVRA